MTGSTFREGSVRSALVAGLAALTMAATLSGCITITTGGSTPVPGSQGNNGGPSAALRPPAAPTGLTARYQAASDPDAMYWLDELSWTPPAGPLSGYYVNKYFMPGDWTPPTACETSWETLPGTATTYEIAGNAVPHVYMCAFNAAGMSPVVEFPLPVMPEQG